MCSLGPARILLRCSQNTAESHTRDCFPWSALVGVADSSEIRFMDNQNLSGQFGTDLSSDQSNLWRYACSSNSWRQRVQSKPIRCGHGASARARARARDRPSALGKQAQIREVGQRSNWNRPADRPINLSRLARFSIINAWQIGCKQNNRHAPMTIRQDSRRSDD